MFVCCLVQYNIAGNTGLTLLDHARRGALKIKSQNDCQDDGAILRETFCKRELLYLFDKSQQ
jgi:hypothetical protein